MHIGDPPQGRATVPSEYQYSRRIHSRWARAVRALGRQILGYDPAPPDDVVDVFGSMYYDADPLADEFVEEVYLGQSAAQGRAMLDQALTHGVQSVVEAPESLCRLFADLDNDPDWLDPEQAAAGARAFRRYGVDVFRFAGAITLHSYAENSVAKPLILSGGYTGNRTRHRFLETASFWIAVSEPGGLAPGAAGRAAALRVRIMHAFVRRRLLAHPEWDLDAWGVPISQADAVLTLMGGSVAAGLGMRAMGYRTSAAEIEAMMHFWRYVGHLMGVRPQWYPKTISDALQLGFLASLKSTRQSGDDGRALCQSYANAFAPSPQATRLDRIRAALEHRTHLGYTQFFMGPWSYRKNAMPSAGLWGLQPVAKFPLIFAAETMRRAFPPLDDVADAIARQRRETWLSRQLADAAAEFHVPAAFAR